MVEYEISKTKEDLNFQINELKIVDLQLQAAIEALCDIDKEIENLKT